MIGFLFLEATWSIEGRYEVIGEYPHGSATADGMQSFVVFQMTGCLRDRTSVNLAGRQVCGNSSQRFANPTSVPLKQWLR